MLLTTFVGHTRNWCNFHVQLLVLIKEIKFETAYRAQLNEHLFKKKAEKHIIRYLSGYLYDYNLRTVYIAKDNYAQCI